jgi:predicted AlkP superfamily phosphohydrolase/phosphomutase
VDPETGGNLVTGIRRKEEIFSGPHLDEAPDVILDLANGEVEQATALGGALLEPSPKSGTHRMEGVLVAAGPGIHRGKTVDAHILDITPTVLYSLGLPILDSMQGKIPDGLFEDGWLLENPVQTTASREDRTGGKSRPNAQSVEEQKLIERRLKDLGYL